MFGPISSIIFLIVFYVFPQCVLFFCVGAGLCVHVRVCVHIQGCYHFKHC